MAIQAPADGKFRMTWHDDLVTAVLAVTSTMADPALRKYDTAIRQTRKDASNVLAEHPTLKDLLPTSDQWHLYNLTSGIPCKTEKLLSELIDCLLEAAQRTGIKRAVQTCDKLLTDAAERKLPGYELTFFDGLKLSERWDIAPGLYAIPYRTLQKQLRRDVAPVYDPIAFRMDSQGEKSITVLVSELRWGPVIVSSKGRTLKDPYPVEMILTCNHNPLLLVALLTVTLNHPLTLLANTLRAMPWVEDFLHVRGGSCSYFAAEDRLGSHNLAEPNAEIRQVAEQVFRDWGSLSSADRDTLALAITRLSTSLLRSGMGTVKFSGSVADLADETRHAELPWISIPTRHYQPRRLAVSPLRCELSRCRRSPGPTRHYGVLRSDPAVVPHGRFSIRSPAQASTGPAGRHLAPGRGLRHHPGTAALSLACRRSRW